MAVYFLVELQLEQQYNYVGTTKEHMKSMHKIGGDLHGNIKKRLEIIQSTHC